jgi:peptide/nickel transport system ATP-binding protein
MYLGYIVEQGTTDQIFAPPYHPYTEALLSAIPIADTSVVKKHIVLEGDIPSAMNPPSGCPFQTRCGYKHLVPGNKCETQVPPVKNLGDGHQSLCWLSDDVLATMEPVISFAADHAANEGVPEDAPHGTGPGFAGAAPRRPRGKTAQPAAGKLGGAVEEAEASGHARRQEVRSDRGGQGAGATRRSASTVAPFEEKHVGSGRQALDEGVPSAFAAGKTVASAGTGSPKAAAAKRPAAAKQAARAKISPRAQAVAAPTARKPAAAPSTPADRNRPAGIAKPKSPDDLKLIAGVGPKIETILNGLGIYRFEQVAAWKKAEREWVDAHLRFGGRIERDDWVRQAKALAKGGEAEYVRVFGKKPR